MGSCFQPAADFNLRAVSIYTPGSTLLFGKFEGSWQGGDSAYGLRLWRMTPHPNPTTGPQRRYTESQMRTTQGATTRCASEEAVTLAQSLLIPLKEKKTQSKCMFRLGDDDIESPYKKFLDTFDFFV